MWKSPIAVLVVLALLTLAACSRELAVPEEPPPVPVVPGSLSGRLVVAEPGSAIPVPAAGASVQLLGSNVGATSNAEGRFTVSPLTSTEGQLLVRFDRGEDGTFARQRLLSLRELGAEPGVDVSAGDVLLLENAVVRGRVRRADLPGATSQGGTAIFLPGGPYAAQTGDDGSFVLPDVPAGSLVLGVFRDGYAPATLGPLEVRAGEELTLRDLVLQPAPMAALVEVEGVLRFEPAVADPAGATVLARAPAREEPLALDAAGAYGGELPPGLYTFVYGYPGYSELAMPNVLVVPVGSGAALTLAEVTLSPGQAEAPDPGPGPGPADPPVAVISSAVTGAAGARFTLDASGSTGPGALSFHWRQTAGDTVELDASSGPEAARASFDAPPTPQELAFALTVQDLESGLTAEASTRIRFGAPPLVVVEASPTRARAGELVTLDASGSRSAGGGPVELAWSQSAGQELVILVPDPALGEARVTFQAPPTAQALAFVLTVTDVAADLAARRTVLVDVFAPPEAAIAPVGPVRTGAAVVLDGSGTRASAGAPLTFTWRETTGAGPSFSPNGDLDAAVTSFTAPAAAGTLLVELEVTDLSTGFSDVATTAVQVGRPPVAIVTPAALTVLPGRRIRLDGSGSDAPPGSAWSWTLVGGDAAAASPLDQALLDVDVGAAAFRAELVITSPLGIASDPAAAVVLVDAAAPGVPPSLVVGPNRTVAVGEVVVLSASATHPFPDEALDFTWTAPPGISLVEAEDGATTTASFVAPGPPARHELLVEVTGSSGGTASAAIRVEVVDGLPPVVVDSVPASGTATGSWLGAWARFDEALDPASVPGNVGLEDAGGAPVPADATYDPARWTVTLFPRAPLSPGADYTFVVGAVTDASVSRNVHAGLRVPFRAAPPTLTVASSSTFSVEEVRPGLAYLGGVLQVTGRHWGVGARLWVLELDGAALVDVEQPSGFDLGGIPGRRTVEVGGEVYVMTGTWGTPAGLARRAGGSWSVLPDPCESFLFADATSVFSVGSSCGSTSLHVEVLDLAAGAWAGRTEVDAVESYRFAAGAASGGRVVVAAALTGQDQGVQLFERSGGAPFAMLPPLPGSADATGDLRIAFVAGQPVVLAAAPVGGVPQLLAHSWDGAAYTDLGSAGTGQAFDVAVLGETLFVAVIEASDVRLRRLTPTAASPSWEDVPGPAGPGLRVDPACTPGAPALLATEEALYVAWEERCNGNQWYVRLAALR